MELFYHYAINLDLKYIVIKIYFSPVLFIITEIVLILLWLLIIFLISVYKKIKIINLLNSGFVISPSFISIFYFLNKYILKISISTFGEILISTIIIWIILTGLAFLFSTLEIEIGGFISLSVKSILSRKKRTLGAIFGIAISVALIVVPKPLVTGYYYQIGILAGKYFPKGWQPSHEFVSRFGDLFTKNIFILEDKHHDAWFRGEDIRGITKFDELDRKILVIRDANGRNLGRGKMLSNRLKNMLPTRLF